MGNSTAVQPLAIVKKPVDWDAIEPHYRANVRSLKDIGTEYGVSDAGILKHAKKHKWVRDLGAKIKHKADAAVSAAAVSAEVSAKSRVLETVIVEANAQLQATIRLAHRADIQRSRRLTMNLLEELEVASDNRLTIEQLGLAMLTDGQADIERLKVFDKVMSLNGRATTMKTLSESLKTMVALERQAFGIDDKESTSGTLEDWLAKLGD